MQTLLQLTTEPKLKFKYYLFLTIIINTQINKMSRHIKERQNSIYCLNFLKKLKDLFGTRVPNRKIRTEKFQ